MGTCETKINLMFPCKDGWGSQAFTNTHYGIDIGWLSSYSSNGKTDILAAADGEVVFEGYYSESINGKAYNPIGAIIKHDFGDEYDYYSIYWHLSSTCICKGKKVKMGQKIGVRGNTGYSNGVHLHFQMIKLNKGAELPPSYKWKPYSFNPIPYLTCYDDIQVFRDGYRYNIKHVAKFPTEEENKPAEPEINYKALYEAEKIKLEDLTAKYNVEHDKLVKVTAKLNEALDTLK